VRIIWKHSASTGIDDSAYRLIHRYEAFSLVDYFGSVTTLESIPHQLTDDLPLLVNGNRVTIPAGTFHYRGHPRTLLRFAGPIIRAWVTVLNRLGVQIHFYCPPYGICVELPEKRKDVLAQLREALPALLACAPYQAEHCKRHEASLSPSVSQRAGMAKGWVDLVFFTRQDRLSLQRKLIRLGKKVIAQSAYKLRLIHTGSLDELRVLKGVKLANYSHPCIVTSATSQELLSTMGLSTIPAGMLAAELDGQGQIIAIADTGLDRGSSDDALHPDFRGRVRTITSWPVNESWSAYVKQPGADDGAADTNSGHGTHVAGLALGSGEASEGRYRGVAPAAGLVFQAIEQYTAVSSVYQNEIKTGYYLSGRPLDLRELFMEAHDLGARIHVNAWGDPARGGYTDDCYEADDYLRKHPDAVVLFAAGNDGADRDGNRRIDAASLYAPASAKNTIAIGATEGPRQGVGLRVNWDAFNKRGRRRFANRADRDDAISGEPEHIALISSAGPTMDGRIKPDLCAPGTNLAAARTQAANVRGWGLASPMPYYMYYGGTSMSTGVAGGYFAVLRQSWQAHLGGIAPSGVALKALAILAARPVLRRDSHESEPREIAGYGGLDLANALPRVENRIQLVDHREPGLNSGEVHEYSFRLNKAQAFRATLCWYDAPGEALLNNLDLCLLDESGIVHWGNHPAAEIGEPDRVNTVEVIEVASLAAGNYSLQVIGANIPVAPQTYALVYKAPFDEGPDLPFEWIRGIGPTYAKRLQGKGVKNFTQLMDLSLDELSSILQRRGRSISEIRAKLILLEERLGETLAIEIPAETKLSQLGGRPPDGVSLTLWENMNRRLLPLIDVFDRRVLKRIRLGDLF